jgi:hypothetical protein
LSEIAVSKKKSASDYFRDCLASLKCEDLHPERQHLEIVKQLHSLLQNQPFVVGRDKEQNESSVLFLETIDSFRRHFGCKVVVSKTRVRVSLLESDGYDWQQVRENEKAKECSFERLRLFVNTEPFEAQLVKDLCQIIEWASVG